MSTVCIQNFLITSEGNPVAVKQYSRPIPPSPGPCQGLIRKDPGAGKDWGQEEKGMTED